MPAVEFDAFADDYTATHARNLDVSGETPDYFARYKIEELRRSWSATHGVEPAAILDFGCGVGSSLPHLVELFPTSAVSGIDVSERSLAVARTRAPKAVGLQLYDGRRLHIAAASQDLVFSACVFHHIPPDERSALLAELRRVLRPGGSLVTFEHNPYNPVTRYIVATCPFDEHAILLPAAELVRRQRDVGFANVRVRFTGFFPAALKALRRFEGALRHVPLGAQYYTVADA